MSEFLLAETIREFLASKQVDAGLADHSTDAYSGDLKQFLEAMQKEFGTPNVPVASIQESHLEDYFRQKTAEGWKSSTLARKITAVRQLFKFCALEFDLHQNPAENLRSGARPRRLPKALPAESMQALLAATEEGLPYATQRHPESLRARDRAMITLLYATGVRVSELLSLKASETDLENNVIRVFGKGSKERLVPFVDVARDRLLHYLHEHRPYFLRNALRKDLVSEPDLVSLRLPLFLTERGTPLTRQGFWKLLKNLGLKAGLTEDLSPHWLRHTFATHLLEAGMGLRTLQTLLGHADVSMTEIYTEVTPGHLKEIHARFHPRGGGKT